MLTDGEPVGPADAVALDFFATAQHGKPTEDRLELAAGIHEQETGAPRSPIDYAQPPDDASAPRSDSTYTGTYANPYHGPLTVTETGGDLTMRLGPKPMTFRLTHYDGDTYYFDLQTVVTASTSRASASASATAPGPAAPPGSAMYTSRRISIIRAVTRGSCP